MIFQVFVNVVDAHLFEVEANTPLEAARLGRRQACREGDFDADDILWIDVLNADWKLAWTNKKRPAFVPAKADEAREAGW